MKKLNNIESFVDFLLAIYLILMLIETRNFDFEGAVNNVLQYKTILKLGVVLISMYLIIYLIRRWPSCKKILENKKQSDEKKNKDNENISEHDQFKNISNQLSNELKCDSNRIITLNGKFGSGKSTIIDALKKEVECKPIIHIQLWNLDSSIDKTTYIINEIIDRSIKLHSLLIFVFMYIFFFVIFEDNIIIEILLSLYFLLKIYMNRVVFAIWLSKVKSIPFSLISDVIWKEVHMQNKIYVIEDIDRLDRADQLQVLEFAMKINESNQNRVIISLSLENISDDVLESFHKLETKIVNVNYDMEIVISNKLKEQFPHQSDIDMASLILAIQEVSDGCNVGWRFLKYYTNEFEEYAKNGYSTASDMTFSMIYNYHYGYSVSNYNVKILQNDFIQKIDKMINGDIFVNTLIFENTFYRPFDPDDDQYKLKIDPKMQYVGDNQLVQVPRILTKYISTYYSKNQTTFHPRIWPVKNILNTYESDSVKADIKNYSSEPNEFYNGLTIVELVFQDLLLNRLIEKGHQIDLKLQSEKMVILNERIKVLDDNLSEQTKVLAKYIENIIDGATERINESDVSILKVDNCIGRSIKYLGEPLNNGLDLPPLADVLNKYDPTLENIWTVQVIALGSVKILEHSQLLSLVVIFFVNNDLIKYVSPKSPLHELLKVFREELEEKYHAHVYKLFNNKTDFSHIDDVINQSFQTDSFTLSVNIYK